MPEFKGGGVYAKVLKYKLIPEEIPIEVLLKRGNPIPCTQEENTMTLVRLIGGF